MKATLTAIGARLMLGAALFSLASAAFNLFLMIPSHVVRIMVACLVCLVVLFIAGCYFISWCIWMISKEDHDYD
jgi:hypothetical protein